MAKLTPPKYSVAVQKSDREGYLNSTSRIAAVALHLHGEQGVPETLFQLEVLQNSSQETSLLVKHYAFPSRQFTGFDEAFQKDIITETRWRLLAAVDQLTEFFDMMPMSSSSFAFQSAELAQLIQRLSSSFAAAFYNTVLPTTLTEVGDAEAAKAAIMSRLEKVCEDFEETYLRNPELLVRQKVEAYLSDVVDVLRQSPALRLAAKAGFDLRIRDLSTFIPESARLSHLQKL